MRPRRISQVLSAVAINPYFAYFSTRTIYQGGLKGFCVPVLNCYACPLAVFSCPIGGLQHAFVLFSPKTRGIFSQAWGALLYVLGTVGLVGAVLGRFPCGWFCPFGFLQDLLYKIPTPKLRLPRWAGWGRYFFLVVVAALIPLFTGVSWFSRLCPAGALEGALPLKLLPPEAPLPPAGWFLWFKLCLLAAFLAWMVACKRPFCRTVCPLGAMLGLCNRISLYRLAVDDSKCGGCGRCRKVCPVDIDVYLDPNSPHCIRCLECIRECPSKAIASGFSRPGSHLRVGRKA